MSETTYRPRVRVVSDATTSGVSAVGCALAVAALAAIARSLSWAARQALQDLRVQAPSYRVLSPACALESAKLPESHGTSALQERYRLSPLEALKVHALAKLQAAPFVVSSAKLDEPLATLCEASSPKQVENAHEVIWNTLANQHQLLMEEHIISACAQADRKTGFSNVRVENDGRGLARVIARDTRGRYLVSEIRARSIDQEPSISTEVFNVADNSCHEILDAFDRALEQEGIRSATPRRRPTGGVCTLEATKELVRRLMQPPVRPNPTAGIRKDRQTTRRGRQLTAKVPNRHQ